MFPAFRLNLYKENYSTLSLNTEGYLYVLFLGITIGLLLYYETSIISNDRYAVVIFLSLFIGTVIPHHYPYDLQGNIHMLCAYLGFSGVCIITIINLYTRSLVTKKLRYIFAVSILAAVIFYLKYGMVNTLSEIIVMLAVLTSNLVIFLRSGQHD